MITSELIAGLAGPLLIAVAAARLLNRHIVARLISGALNRSDLVSSSLFSGSSHLLAKAHARRAALRPSS